jgi:putative transcriptional regulator
MANYHPADELLMQFAAGQLTNALGIQTACHLESCKLCQHKARLYEQLGGDLIDISTPVEIDSNAKSRLLDNLHQHLNSDAKLDNSNDSGHASSPELDNAYREQIAHANQRLPKPLRRFVPDYYDNLPWTGFSKSIQSYDLPFSDEQYTARFYLCQVVFQTCLGTIILVISYWRIPVHITNQKHMIKKTVSALRLWMHR